MLYSPKVVNSLYRRVIDVVKEDNLLELTSSDIVSSKKYETESSRKIPKQIIEQARQDKAEVSNNLNIIL